MRELISKPTPEYSALLGELVYMVSSLEGLIIFDLPRLGRIVDIPTDVSELVGKTTGSIARKLKNAAENVSDTRVSEYLMQAGLSLSEVAGIRNDVLHARPATTPDGRQELYRYVEGRAFFVSKEWMELKLDEIGNSYAKVSNLRPTFEDFPPH